MTRVGYVDRSRQSCERVVADKNTETTFIGSNDEVPVNPEWEMPVGDVRQREFTGHPTIYYSEVISCLRDAESTATARAY